MEISFRGPITFISVIMRMKVSNHRGINLPRVGPMSDAAVILIVAVIAAGILALLLLIAIQI